MAANEFDDDQTRTFTNLSAGAKVSHYKVILKIGAGGMGEVYLAEDTQLDRKVALKFLPSHLSQDEAARARFTREAKAAAKLDHPNIVQVFEVGGFQGRPFFAMAHIEGKSLREVIKEGKLSINETIELTRQICQGLHKAHESGVVHRDIKPGNIIIDEDNKARILDFGLATVAGEDKLTKTGSTLGTVGYMSPEQIEGKKVDHRSDLFSVGVILYEMLTGRRPFEGDTDAAVARSITDTTPEPIARYKSGVSEELQRVVGKALSKDAALRYQTAIDLLADLESVIAASHDAKPRGRDALRKPVIKYLAWGVAAIGLGLVAYTLFHQPATGPIMPVQKQLTMLGDVTFCEMSPDGSQIAFLRSSEAPDISNSKDLYIQDIGKGEPLKLLHGIDLQDLEWSPNGSELAFAGWVEGKMGTYIIPRLGGVPRRYYGWLCSDATIAWSPDGSRILFHESCRRKDVFTIIDCRTGDTTFFSFRQPIDFEWLRNLEWLPDGQRFLMCTRSSSGNQIWLAHIDGSRVTQLHDGSGEDPYWCTVSPGGDALYYLASKPGRTGESLVRQSIDLKSGEKKGEPLELLGDIKSLRKMSVSADGKRLVYTWNLRWTDLWLARKDAGSNVSVKKITRDATGIYGFSASPDGKWIAYGAETQMGYQLFLIPLEGGEKRQPIIHEGIYPAWSPEGAQLAFIALDTGGYEVDLTSLEGGPVRRFNATASSGNYLEWAPGQWILYQRPDVRNAILLDPETGAEESLLPNDSVGWVLNFKYSPDGRKVAFYWNRSGRPDVEEQGPGIWVTTLPDRSLSYIYARSAGREGPRLIGWSDDGTWVYFTHRNDSLVYRVHELNKIVDTVMALPFRISNYATMVPGNRGIVCGILEGRSDIMMVENFDPENGE